MCVYVNILRHDFEIVEQFLTLYTLFCVRQCNAHDYAHLAGAAASLRRCLKAVRPSLRLEPERGAGRGHSFFVREIRSRKRPDPL